MEFDFFIFVLNSFIFNVLFMLLFSADRLFIKILEFIDYCLGTLPPGLGICFFPIKLLLEPFTSLLDVTSRLNTMATRKIKYSACEECFHSL